MTAIGSKEPRTIKKYLKNPEQPRYRRRQPRVGSKLNAQFEARLRELFEHDLSLRRRDRRTAKKLYEELVAEGYTGSYSPVQRFVSELKKSSGTDGTDAFIPLYFAPGDALQFDWSEEYVLLGGIQHKVHVAHFRLCHSRKPFVVAYMNEKQEMVLDAFARALAFFGGVPRRVIIDNPKTMVTYVSRSKDRIFHPRFLALMNHYVIEPVACTPASGWERAIVRHWFKKSPAGRHWFKPNGDGEWSGREPGAASRVASSSLPGWPLTIWRH